MAASSLGKPDIILNSPVGSKPAVYKWPLTYVLKGQKIDGAEEIIETMRWVAREYLEFKPAIENLLPDQPDFKSYECIKSLCDKYNKILDMVMKMNKGTSVALNTSTRASQGLLKHVIQQVYNYAVADPNELNKYSPFSSETYGETSFEFMAQLIEKNQFKPCETDTFIDLGSGVGHLVLQMAASVECKKCYGIEIADVPAAYAKRMEERFKFWMDWHGKTYTEFELFHGDFFAKQYTEIIKNSNFILVNNFAFKPDVDHKLKQRFLDLKDGTKILSSKPFCSSKKSRLTERYLSDIGSIMHMYAIQPLQKKDSVSWTPKPLPYYLHVLDGSKVEKYYEKQKRKHNGTANDKTAPRKRSKTNKHGSDSLSDYSDDNTVYGPTTRKAWSEWCSASSMNTGNRASTDSVKTASSRNNSTDTENLYETTIDEENNSNHLKVPEKISEVSRKRDKKNDLHGAAANHGANTIPEEETGDKSNMGSSVASAKSCLDKKREYAVKSSANSLQNAPPSALYSISKPNGSTSTSRIPNIVIKVKPTLEAKVVNEEPNSATNAPGGGSQLTEVKVNDENGKKLRQRKKSVNTTNETTQASSGKNPSGASKSETNSAHQNASNSILISSASVGPRNKKQQQVSKISAKAGAASKKKISSPEKQSLDLLHAKTVESITNNTGLNLQPAPGCEDYSLRSITETPSLPRVVIKDSSMYVSSLLESKNIDKFVNNMKLELERFAKTIQRPGARESLILSIEHERMRNRELHRAEDELIRHNKLLNERISRSVKAHCDELGIRDNQKCIIGHFGSLLRRHQELSTYLSHLENAPVTSQRPINPPAAHASSGQSLTSPYRIPTSSVTLDLSLK